MLRGFVDRVREIARMCGQGRAFGQRQPTFIGHFDHHILVFLSIRYDNTYGRHLTRNETREGVVLDRSREGGIQQESEWLLIAGVLC